MRLVVDSSVVLKWFVDEPNRDAAASLLDRDDLLFAPDLLLAEVTNALWRKVRKGEVEPLQVRRAINEMSSLLLIRPMTAELVQLAFEIAQELEHSIYDCLFLACAREENADFITADLKFAAKLAGLDAWSNVRVLPS